MMSTLSPPTTVLSVPFSITQPLPGKESRLNARQASVPVPSKRARGFFAASAPPPSTAAAAVTTRMAHRYRVMASSAPLQSQLRQHFGRAALPFRDEGVAHVLDVLHAHLAAPEPGRGEVAEGAE